MRIPQDSLAMYSNNPKRLRVRNQKLFRGFFEIFGSPKERARLGHPWALFGSPEQS